MVGGAYLAKSRAGHAWRPARCSTRCAKRPPRRSHAARRARHATCWHRHRAASPPRECRWTSQGSTATACHRACPREARRRRTSGCPPGAGSRRGRHAATGARATDRHERRSCPPRTPVSRADGCWFPCRRSPAGRLDWDSWQCPVKTAPSTCPGSRSTAGTAAATCRHRRPGRCRGSAPGRKSPGPSRPSSGTPGYRA